MAADVALDSLHVVVAADVAYRVSFAFRESLRISRAERAVQHEWRESRVSASMRGVVKRVRAARACVGLLLYDESGFPQRDETLREQWRWSSCKRCVRIHLQHTTCFFADSDTDMKSPSAPSFEISSGARFLRPLSAWPHLPVVM